MDCGKRRRMALRPSDATLVIRQFKDHVAVDVLFIASPLTLIGERCIRFAIQATPPKKLHPAWHQLRFMPYRKDYNLGKRTDKTYMSTVWWNLWSDGCSLPRVNDPEKMRKTITEHHRLGMAVFPYLAPTHLALNSAEGYRYGMLTREWAKLPYNVSLPATLQDDNKIGAAVVKICVRSGFSEWMAYQIGKLIDEYNIDGIYFDNCTVRACTNSAHGCGYENEKGVLKPTIPFLAMRRFFMMVRNEFYKRGKQPLIWCHGAEYPGQISFIDFSVLGEGLYGLDHRKMISLPEMRANFIGPNQAGFVRVFLPQFGHGLDRKEALKSAYTPEITRRLLALTLLHGTPVWGIFCNAAPISKVADLFDTFGEEQVSFLPYWEWEVGNEREEKAVYASLYFSRNRALVAVCNLSDRDEWASLSLQKLNSIIPNLKEIQDPMDSLPLVVESNHIRIYVKGANFRILMLR